jgi:hypothetical protein
MTDIGKGLEESGQHHFEVIYHYLSGGTEENHADPNQVWSITTRLTCLVMRYGQVQSQQCFEGIYASIFNKERTGPKEIPLSLIVRNMFEFKIWL